MRLRWLLALACAPGAVAVDNGIGLTPPMGWTSWNSLGCGVTQRLMERAMDAVAGPAPHGAVPAAPLRSFGYVRIGLDDCWQACGAGVRGSFHDAAGNPLVNLTAFPDMGAMNAHGRALGLEVGWYWNNCECSEHEFRDGNAITNVYEGNMRALTRFRYDGLKVDSCSQFGNISRWADLANATGRRVMIEDCHASSAPRIDDATG
eukprot:gene6734-6253_t